MRLTWVQPEDLVCHELWRATREARDPVALPRIQERWVAGGGAAYGPELGMRLRSAWLGRAERCVLGEPVEKIPRAGIIDGTPEDDDLNDTIMAPRVLEQHGADFTSDDVARGWVLDLPAGRSVTAERVTYRNLYGWQNPGHHVRAAEWAWRDAAVSHTPNGLYGAMDVAATASEAVTSSDIEVVLDVGASVVPPQRQIASSMGFDRELASTTEEPVQAYAVLEAEFAGMHWMRCLDNTALVAYALSVGAVAVAVAGPGWIATRWTDPLRNLHPTSLPGADQSSFGDLAARTLAITDRVRPR